MHRFQIKIRTIFLELLLVYPVINIMGCAFFSWRQYDNTFIELLFYIDTIICD